MSLNGNFKSSFVQKSILATIAYYDVLDYPLRADEVRRFLISHKQINPKSDSATLKPPKSLSGIRGCIGQLVSEKQLETYEQYYFLPEREYLVPLREKKEKIWQEKMKKAQKAVKWLNFVPFVRAVFASGSLGLGNTDELSDLDVLIVVKHGRIWTARFLITSMFFALGIRRKSYDKIAPDKICLNHYITDRFLHINLPSIYNAQTYISLKPLVVVDKNIPDKFRKENNWVLDYIHSWPEWDMVHAAPDSLAPKACRKALEFMLRGAAGGIIEKMFKRWQVRKIESNPLSRLPGSKVVYCDEKLEFHPESPEKGIINKYNQKLTSTGLI